MTRLSARVRAAGERVHRLMPGQRRGLRTARWWLLGGIANVALLIAVPVWGVENVTARVALSISYVLAWSWATHVAYQRDAVLNMAVSVAAASVRTLRPDLGAGTITVATEHGTTTRHMPPPNPPA